MMPGSLVAAGGRGADLTILVSASTDQPVRDGDSGDPSKE